MSAYTILFSVCLLSLNCSAQKGPNVAALQGAWQVELSIGGIGNIATTMTFDIDDHEETTYKFHAYSKKGVDRQILGTGKSLMARWFSNGFKYGSLLHIENGMLSGDSLSGTFTSAAGNYYLNGHVENGHIKAIFTDRNHDFIGDFVADRHLLRRPLRNYPDLFDKTIAITKAKIYDPTLLKTPGWHRFEKEMRAISKQSEDDATFVMAFFYYSRQCLGFSHYGLLRPLKEEGGNYSASGHILFEEKSKDVAYLKINSFSGSSTEMDSILSLIASKKYKTLIADFRDNGGGTIEAGMAFMRHLVADTLYGGIFLTQKYFLKHTSPPSPDAYAAYAHFSEANYDLIIKGISEEEGICLVVHPSPPIFNGRLYVLTNNRTASTCEPIVYGLKQYHRAIIIGKKTAGAMLNGEKFGIDSTYALYLPTATYYTADGFKIDGKGVVPDIMVPAAAALDTAVSLIHR